MSSASVPKGTQAISRGDGASALVRALEAEGVTHVFGLCGHTNVAVLAALESSRIRFVGVHHEQMASHAADGYSRVTGKPGVVLTHLGPGMTNALTGVANAALDNVPMVVITGNVQSYFAGRHAHMETTMHGDSDQSEAYAPFCKWIWRVQRADALLSSIAAAFRIASTEPKGPVLLDVSMDVFSSSISFDDAWTPMRSPTLGGLTSDTAREIVQLLLSAERPVIYVGAGVAHERAGAEVVDLAEALNAPIAYELMAKGALDDQHELVVGMSGFWGTPVANEVCRSADVILAVGVQFGELDSSSWKSGVTFSIPPTRLVQIGVDPMEIGRSYQADIGVVANPKQALVAIRKQISQPALTVGLRADLVQLRDDFRRAVNEMQKSDAFPLHPARVVADTFAALGPDDLMVGDTGWNKNGVAQQIPFGASQRFIAPGGYATMGFGPAAVLGSKLGRPDVASVALVGDGAFLSNLSVIVTAVEECINVVWVVMNNGTYATISGMQRRHFDSDYGSSFSSSQIDYVGIARSIGADGYRVGSADELVPALKKAIAASAPFVLDVPCGLENVPTTGFWDINSLFAQGMVTP